MSNRVSIIALFFLPFYCFGQGKVLVIKNAAIIDVVNNKVTKHKMVVIEGNKIVTVGNKADIPRQATIINAKGKYLIPGLWDMHTHNSLRKDRIAYFMPLFIANGVTGIRDMASDMTPSEMMEVRNEIETSKMLGPRLGAMTGKVVDGPPQPDTAMFTYPADTSAAKQLVWSYKRQNLDFIKVYNMLSREVYAVIAGECKKNNIPFAGHVPFSVTAVEASQLGQYSIEHLSDVLISVSATENELRSELVASKSVNAIQSSNKRMEANFKAALTYSKEKASTLFSIFVRNNTWHCPTLRNLQIVTADANVNKLMNDPRTKYFPNSIKENWKRVLLLRTIGDSAQRIVFFRQTLKLVGDMYNAGVKLLAGTDLASNFLMPGFSLHDELSLMVEAGLSPFAALQTATINPARFLQRDRDLGTVEKGKLADLVLLDDNPLDNINNTRKIYAVIINGNLLQRSDLDNMLLNVEKAVKN
jgi:hypothetical protein